MTRHESNWWFGVADMAASGINHGALKLERVHLSIADETFNLLRQVPVTSRGVRAFVLSITAYPASLTAVSRWRPPTLGTWQNRQIPQKMVKLRLNSMKRK